MFNLTNLIQTTLITMGVANATPICNENKQIETPIKTTLKNENQVNDYELTLGKTTATQHFYTIQNAQGDNTPSAEDREFIQNYQLSSNYLTVLATNYATLTVYYNDNISSNVQLIQNNRALQSGIDEEYDTVSRLLYVFQITPYNYNIDTDTSLQLTLDLDSYEESYAPYDVEYTPTAKYYVKRVYTCFQNDWSQYIGRQPTSLQAMNIIKDIESVNNGFYYTKTSTKITMNSINQYDTTVLNITPKTTNYVMIEYIPCADMSKTFSSPPSTEQIGSNVPVLQTLMGWNWGQDITVTGTNVIVDTGYEVIDIPGLMWEILTMPFAFVSQAFNLTLFPGTPYQINIANLFLSIIAIFIFVWVISFFLKMKG